MSIGCALLISKALRRIITGLALQQHRMLPVALSYIVIDAANSQDLNRYYHMCFTNFFGRLILRAFCVHRSNGFIPTTDPGNTYISSRQLPDLASRERYLTDKRE